MATTKNITMKQFNGTDYDTLYPKTVYNQVSGVAPDGYGLGAKTGKMITDGNDALVGGWFYWGNIDTNLPFTYGHMRVDPRLSSTSGQILMQTAYSDSYPGCVAQRKMMDGAFKPWEWVNPPMQLGVEYRTTERYQRKPVYVKLVDLGNCPSSGFKDVTVLGDTEVGFRCEGEWTFNGGSTLPFETTSSDRMAIAIIGKNVRIFTGGKDFSIYTAKATIYYTKTTD